MLTTSRPHLARIHRRSRPSLLHNLLRNSTQRRNRRHPPRALSRTCTRIMGLLGLLRSHHLARHSSDLLVCDSEYERRERCQVHDRRHLAELLDAEEYHS